MVAWVAMESNPEVWNKFLTSMGVSGDWRFTDVWGLDPELLMMVPQPVAALLLLFPISEKTESWSKAKVESCKDNVTDPDVFYMKQTVGNACGTVAILHSLLNNKDRIVVGDLLTKFATDCESADPLSRANLLAENEDIAGKHATAANQGQTAAPNADDKINLHFVAFVSVNGSLYELDGRKDGPVNWGPCLKDELLSTAAGACKEYMSSDPDEYRFTVVALSKDC